MMNRMLLLLMATGALLLSTAFADDAAPPAKSLRYLAVQPGETWMGLSFEAYGDMGLWQMIMEANGQPVTPNSRPIPGSRVLLPIHPAKGQPCFAAAENRCGSSSGLKLLECLFGHLHSLPEACSLDLKQIAIEVLQGSSSSPERIQALFFFPMLPGASWRELEFVLSDKNTVVSQMAVGAIARFLKTGAERLAATRELLGKTANFTEQARLHLEALQASGLQDPERSQQIRALFMKGSKLSPADWAAVVWAVATYNPDSSEVRSYIAQLLASDRDQELLTGLVAIFSTRDSDLLQKFISQVLANPSKIVRESASQHLLVECQPWLIEPLTTVFRKETRSTVQTVLAQAIVHLKHTPETAESLRTVARDKKMAPAVLQAIDSALKAPGCQS